MFYDERIELEKGKLCQSILILTVCFSLPYWLLHALYVYKNITLQHPLPLLALDAAVGITSLALLTVGLCRNRGSDEREQFQRYRYYSRVMPIFIAVVSFFCAVMLPLQEHLSILQQFSIYAVDEILEPLLFLVGSYSFYRLKKREIYCNYRFMESEHYYRQVWKNIGKFSLLLLGSFAVSMVTLALLPQLAAIAPTLLFRADAENLLHSALITLARCVSFLLGGSLLYLLLSFLERESYRKLSGLSRSVCICSVVLIGIYLLHILYSFLMMHLSAYSSQLSFPMYTYLPNIAYWLKTALVMFLVYFSYEYQRQKPSRGIRWGCMCILLTVVGTSIFSQYHSKLIGIFLREWMQNPDFMHWYNIALQLKNYLILLLCLSGGICILLTLIRDHVLSHWNLAMLPVAVAGFAVYIVLETSEASLEVRNCFSVTFILLLLCCFSFLIFQVTKHCNRISEESEA